MYATQKKKLISDQLVQDAIENEKAMNKLVTLCFPRVFKTIDLSLGGSSDVDDLVQQTLILMIVKLEHYHGPDKFTAWLDKLTLNNIRMHLKKNSNLLKKTVVFEQDSPNYCDFNTPEKNEADRQLYVLLHDHLRKMKPKIRSAIILSLFHEYNAREIGEISGCSEEAAWKRVQRGFKILKGKIQKDHSIKTLIGGIK